MVRSNDMYTMQSINCDKAAPRVSEHIVAYPNGRRNNTAVYTVGEPNVAGSSSGHRPLAARDNHHHTTATLESEPNVANFGDVIIPNANPNVDQYAINAQKNVPSVTNPIADASTEPGVDVASDNGVQDSYDV